MGTVAERQIVRAEGIDDTVCARCKAEPVTHRMAVTPLDPTTESPDGGMNFFVSWRLGDMCVRSIEVWFELQ